MSPPAIEAIAATPAADTIDWLTPAADLPWPLRIPFRMQPNLAPLDPPGALRLSDAQAAAYRREKARILRDSPERALLGHTPPAVLAELAHQLGLQPTDGADGIDAHQLSLQLQEDFAILRRSPDGCWHSELLSICFPSRWDPRDKLNADFAHIHAPVPDSERLLAAAPAFMQLAFGTRPMQRHVWLLSPSARLAQHPADNDTDWHTLLARPEPLLDHLHWRIERQTTLPLPAHQRGAFLIRILTAPLRPVLALDPQRPAQLAAALRSMSPAVLAYRGMSAALPRLLRELEPTLH